MGTAKHPEPSKKYYGDDFYQLFEEAMRTCPTITQQNQKYFVYLLVIDGDYFNNQQTIDTLVECEDFPISIIIVGVGSSSFSNCKKFDADDEPLVHSSGRKQKRDIVQFVKFNDFANDPEGLAAEVLAEIPQQMTQFFQMKNIFPNNLQ